MRLRLLKAIILSTFLLFITPSPVLSQPTCLGVTNCHLETSASNCQADEVFCKGGSPGPNDPTFCCPSGQIIQPLTTSPPSSQTTSTTSTPTTFSQPSSTGTQNRHPLRPKPKEFTNWEKDRPVANYTQALFCAQRPTAVQKQEFLKTDDELKLQITGTYLSNFEEFITPLLSITNKTKDDYNDSYEKKAQQYLADYLGGRAYYELEVEPTQQELKANPQLQYDLFIRLGVFRKLAPLSLQDKFKRAMIYRASGIPAAANPNNLEPLDFFTNYYGFEPASPIVENYPVTCLWGNNIVAFTQYNDFTNPCGNSQNIRLSTFDETNWAPLPEEFNTLKEYASASAAWKILDGGQIDPDTGKIIELGKWAKTWPYVPMFSREDLQGYIRAVNPNADPTVNPVYHPHLARTYELSSAISTLLLPKNNFDFDSDPDLETDWNGIPWCDINDKGCKKWWIDSSDTLPDLALGPVCDPLNTIITSSGDSAYDSNFTTPVNSPTQIITNPEYSPAVVRKCNLLERNDPDTYEKECKFEHDVRYSPDYFVTRTPYLNQIFNRLVSSQGVFNVLRPKAYVDVNQPANWPGLGNPEEITPSYRFVGGGAETGMKWPGGSVEFYYKGLGFIHCQKEKLLAFLQFFLWEEETYEYLSPECTQDSTSPSVPGQPGQPGKPGKGVDKELYGPPPNVPSESTCTQGVNPIGQWLRWPYQSASSASITSCYKDPDRKSCHAGIDMNPGHKKAVYPAASGKVHAAFGGPKGCEELGACVIIDHCNGWFTIYAHLTEWDDRDKLVRKGQLVTTNTQIGIQGNTGKVFSGRDCNPKTDETCGAHLHFGLAWGGSIRDFWYNTTKTANVCTFTKGCSCTSSSKCTKN